jgi:hypothetical protein
MITSLRDDLNLLMLRSTYFAKFQSLIRYGIILWGGDTESVKILKIIKKIPCSIKGLIKTEYCRQLFRVKRFLQ